MPIMQNKANSGPGVQLPGDGMCETNPICTGAEASVGQAPPYKGVQLRQTNPISGSPAGTEGRNMRNKPNLPGEAGQSSLTPRPSGLAAPPEAVVQNEANFRFGDCGGPSASSDDSACRRHPDKSRPSPPPFALTFAADTNRLFLRPMNRPKMGVSLQIRGMRGARGVRSPMTPDIVWIREIALAEDQ